MHRNWPQSCSYSRQDQSTCMAPGSIRSLIVYGKQLIRSHSKEDLEVRTGANLRMVTQETVFQEALRPACPLEVQV